jgi:hypothetical protein
MKSLLEMKSGLIVLFVLAGGLAALVAMSPLAGRGGALLLALLFWIAVVEGCIAAAAAGTLVNARWVASVKRELFSLAPLLLLLAFLLLLLVPFLEIYPWTGRPGIWLRKDFFIGRNLILLLLVYITARRFAAASGGNGGDKTVRAATYLLVFVASQTLAAFDLVMSLEYPWVSALLGGYFFIESIYAGFAVSAVLSVLFHRKPSVPFDPEARSALKDLSVLMFGFSLMWAGLFFAQYLTIWYGNLPEEVSFIAKRVSASPLRELSVAVLFLLFFFPFPLLLSTRAKSNPAATVVASASILSGILVERYVFLAPVVLPGFGALAIDFLCLLLPFTFVAWRGARGLTLDA